MLVIKSKWRNMEEEILSKGQGVLNNPLKNIYFMNTECQQLKTR